MQSGAAVEADTIAGEQQLKRTQSGRSRRDRDQQLKRTQSRSSRHKRGAAAEADAIGEQQLCTESCPAPDYSRLTVGERGGSS